MGQWAELLLRAGCTYIDPSQYLLQKEGVWSWGWLPRHSQSGTTTAIPAPRKMGVGRTCVFPLWNANSFPPLWLVYSSLPEWNRGKVLRTHSLLPQRHPPAYCLRGLPLRLRGGTQREKDISTFRQCERLWVWGSWSTKERKYQELRDGSRRNVKPRIKVFQAQQGMWLSWIILKGKTTEELQVLASNKHIYIKKWSLVSSNTITWMNKTAASLQQEGKLKAEAR